MLGDGKLAEEGERQEAIPKPEESGRRPNLTAAKAVSVVCRVSKAVPAYDCTASPDDDANPLAWDYTAALYSAL